MKALYGTHLTAVRFLPQRLYEQIMETCTVDELRDGVANPMCARLLDEMDRQIGGYFEYALYDDCTYENSLLSPVSWRDVRRPLHHRLKAARGALNDYACGGGPAMDIWVNRSEVRDALHVPRNSAFYSFDNAENFDYRSTEKSLIPFYRFVALFTPLRVLIYNGDTDPNINSIAAQNWTNAINLPVEEDWRPWTLDGRQRMGGYVTRFAGETSFLTIRGAGHMVPQYKPAATFEFLRAWLHKEPFKRYVRPSEAAGH